MFLNFHKFSASFVRKFLLENKRTKKMCPVKVMSISYSYASKTVQSEHGILFLDRKLTVLSFFLCSSFVLEYADSSNQRDFFLRGSLVLRICPIKSVEYA